MSWYRVAVGVQMVAKSAARSASSDLGRISVRAGQHLADIMTKSSTSSSSSSSSDMDNNLEGTVTTSARNENPFSNNHGPNSMETGTKNNKASSSVQGKPPAPPSQESASETTSSPTQSGIETQQEATSPTIHTNGVRTDMEESSSTILEAKSIQNVSLAQENRIVQPRAAKMEDLKLLKEGRSVPSTRFGRALGFAQLGLGLVAGTAVEGVSRLFGGGGSSSSSSSSSGSSSSSWVVNDSNSDRVAASLCRMRGAALKMGQMLSIQDESLLPPALSRALRQVRQGAEAMPKRQLLRQMAAQLGPDWRQRFLTFEEAPFAAASIGQVHRATILDRDTGMPKTVVVKVQYPGVARSIESDLRNLSMLVTMTGLAPKGLFIENVIRVGQQELKVECDYLREMENQKRIKNLVEKDPFLISERFVVPDVIKSHSTNEILTSEYMPGGTIDKVSSLDQDERNRIGRTILYLTMKELFEWRFMQTDPNWGNFLYDVGSGTTGLIDFGAAREYSREFVDGYLRIVWASANRDEETLMAQSSRMGFLTGHESDIMLRAHKLSGFTVGEPFWEAKPFDFRGSSISSRMGEHTAVFLRHRLTPPPEEVYTLHRKLAGAYMLCIKLGAVVESRSLLEDFVRKHDFKDGLPNPVL